MRLLEGVVVAHTTPFHEDESIDYEALRKYVNFVIEKKVHGIFVCGTTGEGLILSIEERKKVLETIIEENKGRIAVVAHCGAINLRDTMELIDHAKKVGADGVGIVAPFYYSYTEKELYNYYATIAREFKDIPIYLYNIPSLAKNELSIPLVSKLSYDFENIVGIKDSSGNFSTILGYIYNTRKDFIVITGYDRAFFPSLMMGGKGTVTGPGGVFPEIFVKIYDSFKKKDYEACLELQKKQTKLSLSLHDGASIPVLKKALEFRGIGKGYMRRPFLPLNEEESRSLREDLEKVLLEVGLSF
ncbi:MAG: dihydrodipicolinate synthase family protein [Dictyoglomus sp. NZ13-RE01]|nr:MAG: dihydrodipicolinate synthase family protein [Dictyoglomus sp. NZ13-RE01]